MWLSHCLNPRSRKLELENLAFIYIFYSLTSGANSNILSALNVILA